MSANSHYRISLHKFICAIMLSVGIALAYTPPVSAQSVVGKCYLGSSWLTNVDTAPITSTYFPGNRPYFLAGLTNIHANFAVPDGTYLVASNSYVKFSINSTGHLYADFSASGHENMILQAINSDGTLGTSYTKGSNLIGYTFNLGNISCFSGHKAGITAFAVHANYTATNLFPYKTGTQTRDYSSWSFETSAPVCPTGQTGTPPNCVTPPPPEPEPAAMTAAEMQTIIDDSIVKIAALLITFALCYIVLKPFVFKGHD